MGAAADEAQVVKIGRPSKFEPERVEQILESIRSGMYEIKAAEANGISETTLHRWRKENPDFNDDVIRARAFAEERHLRNVRRAGDNGNWQASAWWLERSFPDRWGRRARLELTGVDDGPVEISITREEARAVSDRFRAAVVRLADTGKAPKRAA